MSIIFAILLIGVFLFPGWVTATYVHQEDKPSPFRWVSLGFGLSFGVFTLISWPCLFFGLSASVFFWISYAIWVIWSLFSVYLAFDRRLFFWKNDSGSTRSLVNMEEGVVAAPRDLRLNLSSTNYLCVIYLLLVWSVALAPRLLGEALTRRYQCLLVLLVLATGVWIAKLAKAKYRCWLAFSETEQHSSSSVWVILALLLTLIHYSRSVLYDQNQGDEIYYLSSVLEYQHTQRFNTQEPTHREGLPVPASHFVMCWELWKAMICKVSGLDVFTLSNTIIPLLFLPLIYTVYLNLFGLLLPKKWVPVGYVGLMVFLLWGHSNLFVTNYNMGKHALMHFGIPMMVVQYQQFATKANLKNGLALVVVVVCSLGFGSTACFISPIVLTSFTLAWGMPRLRNRQFMIGVFAALVPVILAGLLLRSLVMEQGVLATLAPSPKNLLSTMGRFDLVWLMLIPMQAIFIADRSARTYLIRYPAIVLLTFANPAFSEFIQKHFTSVVTYDRIIWTLPIGIGLGTLLAGVIRLTSLLVVQSSSSISTCILLVILGGGYVVPRLVFCDFRHDPLKALGMNSFQRSRLARNLEKMPPDMKSIAHHLELDPILESTRILTDFKAAYFLAPYSHRFRFVESRFMHTPYLFALAGRQMEGLERSFLSFSWRKSGTSMELSRLFWTSYNKTLPYLGNLLFNQRYHQHIFPDIPTLLEQFGVKYAAVERDTTSETKLHNLGFEVSVSGEQFALYKMGANAARNYRSGISSISTSNNARGTGSENRY